VLKFKRKFGRQWVNPLTTKLNPICYLLALLGALHILHVSRIRVQETGLEDVDWFKLAQNRYRWLALSNTVINPGSHKIQGVSTLG
jgi:hypothetical protein